MEKYCFIKAVFVTFSLVLSGILVNVSAIEIENDEVEQDIDNSCFNFKENILEKCYPITIDQYEDGKIAKSFQKELSVFDQLKIILNAMPINFFLDK